jgi:hypothetical protein
LSAAPRIGVHACRRRGSCVLVGGEEEESCVDGSSGGKKRQALYSLLSMHKPLHGGIGRVVFGNEKVRINIGMVDEISYSDIAHGESKRCCTYRCRKYLALSRTCRTRSNAVLLDKKRTKLRREEVSGARRTKYRCGALAAKRPRPGRWDSATTRVFYNYITVTG